MKDILEKTARWLRMVGGSIFNRILKPYLGNKFCPVELVVGDMSYTDHRKMVVGITEKEAEELSKDDIMRILTLKCYHEAGHCKYTDRSEYETVGEAIVDLWADEAIKARFKPHRSGLVNIAAGLLNSLEDGRMENQVVKDVPGVQKHREWYRLREWLKYDSATADVGEFYEVLNNILTIATMGIYCKNFEATYPKGTKVRDVIDSCVEPISGFVKSPTILKGKEHALKIGENLTPFILDIMANEPQGAGDGPEIMKLPPELEDMLRKALESQANFSDKDTEEIDSDGPIISILTDDMETEESNGEAKKPDVIIDLRKNPPEPAPPRLTESEEENKGEGQGNDSSEGEGNNSEGEGNNSSEREDSDSEGEGQYQTGNGSDSSETSSNNQGETSESGEGENEESGASEGAENSLDSEENGKSSGEDGEPSDEESGEESMSGSSTKDQSNATEGDQKVDQGSLQAGAKDFESAIKERLEEAAAETSAEVSTRVSQANKEMEMADRVEEGNTKITKEDIDYLHEHGYLSEYYDEVPSRNVIKDGCYPSIPVNQTILARGRKIETEVKNIIASQSEPERDYLFDGDLDEMAIGRFVTFGQGDIFCQEGDPKEPDMCVYVRQDNSGSMSGKKFDLACEAGALIEQAFKNLVPLKLTYFTGSEFNVIKDWNDNDTSRSYMTDFGHYFYASGGNDDALAIMSAALELTHRPEKHKVLIVISDGAPCCSIEAVTAAVQWARKNGIFVISFFIGDKDFIDGSWELYKTMYEKYFCGVSPEKLGAVLTRFLRTMIESS